jgi:hypothetical protein
VDLKDKIKLPRVQRRKPTTTTTTSTITTPVTVSITEKQIDPNCNDLVAHSYCPPLDNELNHYVFDDSLDEHFLNNSEAAATGKLPPLDHLGVCKAVVKYKRCMDANFYIRCQRTFHQVFVKLDQMTSMCLNAPRLKNSRAILTGGVAATNNHQSSSSSFFCLIALILFKHYSNL